MYLIRERVFDIGDDFDITDENGTKVYHVDGKVLSLRGRLVIENTAGQEVASVHRQLIALRATYSITVGGEKAAEMKKKLFTPFVDKYTIDVPGPDDLTMRGNLFDHEYTIEQDGHEIASVSKKWFRLRDTYAVRIAEGQDDLLLLASVLALDLAQAAEQKKDKDEH